MVKKFLRGINVSLLFLIIISAFSSCANEMNVFGENNNKQINFSVSVPEWMGTDSLGTTKTSRAMPVGGTSLSTSNTFNIIADQNDGAGNYSTLINSQAVSYTNNIWKTSNDYYWPGIANKTISFYAYYPSTISNVSHTVGSAPTLLYTVPSDASNQIDIIAAINPNISGSTSTSTPLTFNHIFAAVKFAVGSSGLPSGNIKSITIDGIKNSGTYTFGSGWSLGSTILSFTVPLSTTITGVNGENITSDVFTLMMIPQIFTNATITLTYTTGTSYKQTISGTWNAGNTYNYNLSKPVNIGDYYYSDGTWGTIAEHVNSTASPIGVIFCNSTSNIDKGHNWNHGYAMALQNSGSANETYPWSISNSGNPTGTYIIGADNIMSDKDGYTHSCYLQTSDYTAGIAAKNYMAKDKNGNTIAVPIGTSGWFLPSSGQWYDICVNLGGMKAYTMSTQNWVRWYCEDDGSGINYASICASNINTYMNAIIGRGYSANLFDINNEYYWTSSEWDASSACHAPFRTVGVAVGNWGKAELCRVRSVIAF